jgi:ATP-dependent RNA helicase SUPV3L1/SUV3
MLGGRADAPPGYRALGKQAVRLDMAEKLLHAAHGARSVRAGKPLVLDPALAVSMGLGTPAYAHLLRLAGFEPIMPRPLPAGAFGPPAPPRWRWRPVRRPEPALLREPPSVSGAFAALAGLVR